MTFTINKTDLSATDAKGQITLGTTGITPGRDTNGNIDKSKSQVVDINLDLDRAKGQIGGSTVPRTLEHPGGECAT